MTDLELQTNYSETIKTKRNPRTGFIYFLFFCKTMQIVTVDLLHMGFGGALGGAPCRKKGQKNMLRST